MMFSLLPFKDAFSGGKVHHWCPSARWLSTPVTPGRWDGRDRAPMVIAPMG